MSPTPRIEIETNVIIRCGYDVDADGGYTSRLRQSLESKLSMDFVADLAAEIQGD